MSVKIHKSSKMPPPFPPNTDTIIGVEKGLGGSEDDGVGLGALIAIIGAGILLLSAGAGLTILLST